ncbi:hypothetical protein HZH66_009893 [Vespula vulgaris]|uniref:Uncharacterized protein n=1 Tax=Vespula vulgaris TaxID=7454 RepID=A0A834N240_VESVU|nr:hypothetical protein HZH66_009893 [Vespula vulgaris]
MSDRILYLRKLFVNTDTNRFLRKFLSSLVEVQNTTELVTSTCGDEFSKSSKSEKISKSTHGNKLSKFSESAKISKSSRGDRSSKSSESAESKSETKEIV